MAEEATEATVVETEAAVILAEIHLLLDLEAAAAGAHLPGVAMPGDYAMLL